MVACCACYACSMSHSASSTLGLLIGLQAPHQSHITACSHYACSDTNLDKYSVTCVQLSVRFMHVCCHSIYALAWYQRLRDAETPV